MGLFIVYTMECSFTWLGMRDTYTNLYIKDVFQKHKIYIKDIFLKHKIYIVICR